MPENFSKLNISSPKDLDFVLATLSSHARTVAKEKLADRGQNAGSSVKTVNDALDQVRILSWGWCHVLC
jgi:hypothetical protein